MCSKNLAVDRGAPPMVHPAQWLMRPWAGPPPTYLACRYIALDKYARLKLLESLFQDSVHRVLVLVLASLCPNLVLLDSGKSLELNSWLQQGSEFLRFKQSWSQMSVYGLA